MNNTNKTTAGLLALILGLTGFGCLGIHKFVMGYTKQGVVYLLLSLVGGVVTCGISAAIMSIISIVEGIVYLTKSDAEYHRDYVIGRKEWF